MRIDWKKIAVLGTVSGMIIVTGCANNVPENNHGNRNGERLTSAATRSYENNRPTRSISGAVRNTDRTVRHGVGEMGRTATRSINNTAPRGAGAIGDRLSPTAPTHRPARTHAGRVNRSTSNFRDGVDGSRQLTTNHSARNHTTSGTNRHMTRSNQVNRHTTPIALEDSTYSAQHEQFTGNLLHVDNSKQSTTPQTSPNPARTTRSTTARPRATGLTNNTARPHATATPSTTTRSTTAARSSATGTTRNTAPARHNTATTHNTPIRHSTATTPVRHAPAARNAATVRHTAVPSHNMNAITINAKNQTVKPNVSRMYTRSTTNRVAPRTNSVRNTTNSNRSAGNSINRSMNRTGYSTNRSMNRSTGHSMNRSMNRSMQRNTNNTNRVARSERPERVSNRAYTRANTARRTTDMRNRVYESYDNDNGALVRRSIESRRSANRTNNTNRNLTRSIMPMSASHNK